MVDHTAEGSTDSGPRLVAALGAVHALPLSTADYEAFLAELARLAATVVHPGAGCGITVRDRRRPVIVAASDERAGSVEAIQHDAGQGPCHEAMSTGRAVEVTDQRVDNRWREYHEQAVTRGVRSSLSLPLMVDARAHGALTLYHFERAHAFDGRDRRPVEEFARQAATALATRLRLVAKEELVTQLEQALVSRSLIDQAVGVLMAGQRIDAQAAFQLLCSHSQSQNRKLRDVAAGIVTRVGGCPPVDPAPFEQPPPDAAVG